MIEAGHRGLVVGKTGSGKSRLCGYYFATYPGQRLLIDVNDDYELGPDAKAGGACVARSPEQLDLSVRTIRYVPSRLDEDEYEALYAKIWEHVRDGRHPMLVWLDETEGPTSAQRAPLHMRLAVGQGRKKRLSHLAAALRPVEIYKNLRNQAEHAFVFQTIDPDDVAVLARRLMVTPAQLEQAIAALPEHGFLYHRLGGGVTSFAPLDADRMRLLARHVKMP